MSKELIGFEHVSIWLSIWDRTLIKGSNHFQVPAASKVAIVGPTGAGKSTLINLLMRFYPVNSGAVDLRLMGLPDYGLQPS